MQTLRPVPGGTATDGKYGLTRVRFSGGEFQVPAQVMVRLDVAGTPLLAHITRKSAETLALAPGRPVQAQVKSVTLLA